MIGLQPYTVRCPLEGRWDQGREWLNGEKLSKRLATARHLHCHDDFCLTRDDSGFEFVSISMLQKCDQLCCMYDLIYAYAFRIIFSEVMSFDSNCVIYFKYCSAVPDQYSSSTQYSGSIQPSIYFYERLYQHFLFLRRSLGPRINFDTQLHDDCIFRSQHFSCSIHVKFMQVDY